MIQLYVHYSDDPGQVPKNKNTQSHLLRLLFAVLFFFFDSVGKE